jgi:hypothetical protein
VAIGFGTAAPPARLKALGGAAASFAELAIWSVQMILEKLTIGAAALGLLVLTSPLDAAPAASPSSSGASSDISKARNQTDSNQQRGSAASESGRSASKGSKSMKQRGQSATQGRSVSSPRGIAPYSDIPSRATQKSGRSGASQGSQHRGH